MPQETQDSDIKSPGSPALLQGFKVLNALIEAGTAQGIRQLADKTGLPKASVYRLIKSLQTMGYVQQHTTSKQYAVTAQLFSFIQHLTSHFQPTKRATLFLRDAAQEVGHSVYLSMLMGTRSCVVAASGPFGDTAVLGTSGPAYATACGKALVAQLESKYWADYAPPPEAAPETRWTNVSPEHFVAELKRCSDKGVFVSERENSLHCAMAAPVYEPGRPARYALALLLPYDAWITEDRDQMQSTLLKLAEDISLIISPRIKDPLDLPIAFHL
ncbi:IclR family transcriptional regulator [Coraliomargarita parva]|uniref:IclR family transcriptional regulator n=1 Tax=Coraliomargarita parva TaxID=3014050 RepID=UPI0022B40CAF|nr:IclR family transcriptional regulator [Coraliomargarita parva]